MASRSPPAQKWPPAPRSTSTRQVGRRGRGRTRPRARASWRGSARCAGRADSSVSRATAPSRARRDVGVSAMGKVLTTGYRAQQDEASSWFRCSRCCFRRPSRLPRTGPLSPRPSPGPTQSIGFYSAGCLQGAQPCRSTALATRPSASAATATGASRSCSSTSRPGDQGARRRPGAISISAISASRAAGRRRPAMPATRSGSMPTSGSSASPAPRRAAGRPREPAAALAGATPTTPASTTRSSPSSTWSCCARAAEMPNVDRIFVNKFIKQRLCQTVDRQPRLAEQARGLGRPRRALPCPPALPARQSAVPAAGRLLQRRRLRRAARPLVHAPAGHAAAARHAAAALPAEAAGGLHSAC